MAKKKLKASGVTHLYMHEKHIFLWTLNLPHKRRGKPVNVGKLGRIYEYLQDNQNKIF